MIMRAMQEAAARVQQLEHDNMVLMSLLCTMVAHSRTFISKQRVEHKLTRAMIDYTSQNYSHLDISPNPSGGMILCAIPLSEGEPPLIVLPDTK